MPRIALLLLTLSLALSAQDKPNIVILLADDLGYHDVSFNGGEIRTPNIDRIAEEGVELERFYVHPVCSPTRAGLMTGRYPIRYGSMRAVYPPWRKGGLDTSETTLADALGRAGYDHRGVFGKWHLGHSDAKYHPLQRGFTEFFGHYNGAIDYFTHEREGELDWHDGYETATDADGYSTDEIAAKAAGFIERRAGDGPFLCYVPFNAPHSPFQALEADIDPYRALEAVPGDWGNDAQRRKNRRILAGMIAALDRGVGRVLQAIDEAGVRENTLVLFFSDNGGVGGIGSNYPLRGAKASVFEGGIRVAAAVRWPARFASGAKTSAPVANIDVLPTLLAAAGVEEIPGKPLDGVNVLDVWAGKKESLGRELYNYIGQQGEDAEQVSVITPEWKLVVLGPRITDPGADDASKREIFLFEIDRDPNETTNIAQDHPVIVEWLMAKAREFRALQPADAVPPYNQGREGFQAPREWRLRP